MKHCTKDLSPPTHTHNTCIHTLVEDAYKRAPLNFCTLLLEISATTTPAFSNTFLFALLERAANLFEYRISCVLVNFVPVDRG